MTGYAPNPDSCENAAAPLTSSLLARKGQATPAVDAVAHEGVDIDMNSMGAPPPRKRAVSEEAIETIYAENPQSEQDRPTQPKIRAGGRPSRQRSAPQREPITIDSPPQAWSAPTSPRRRQRLLTSSTEKRSAAGQGTLRAIVTFRMPAADFVRLRHASRDMRESCQSIILDALSAYLDANDVESVDETTAVEEAMRLARRGRPKS